jgi:hypothetical protein
MGVYFADTGNTIMKILFFRDPEIIDFEVWTAPGAPDTIPKGGGLRPPPFGVVSGVPVPSRPQTIDDFWVPEQ